VLPDVQTGYEKQNRERAIVMPRGREIENLWEFKPEYLSDASTTKPLGPHQRNNMQSTYTSIVWRSLLKTDSLSILFWVQVVSFSLNFGIGNYHRLA